MTRTSKKKTITPHFKPAPEFTEDLGFEWSQEWELPEKTGTHIQEDWLELLEMVCMEYEDRELPVPEIKDIIDKLIPTLLECKLPTWEDYLQEAIKMLEL